MQDINDSRSLRHFARHLFFVSKVYLERKKAKEEMDDHIHKMRRSIIRMSLSYTEMDRLKAKVENLVDTERRFAKFLKPEDKETKGLKEYISLLEQQIRNQKEENQKILHENDQKILQLTGSLENIKAQMNNLLIERARRHQRLRALEQKITERIDVHGYYET